MTASQQTQPPRFLGEGTVDKVFKRHMFVEDSRCGRIYVPLDAAQPSKPDVFDLREIFNSRDEVVFTATRQQQKQQECNYCACSIVHRNELKLVQGKIVEMLDKYAYVDVPKFGRIFAPFSARTEGARPWHGKNANLGKIVTMKILPQPEFHKCCYVAFAVYPDRPLLNIEGRDDGINGLNAKSDRQPEAVTKQLGMIVIEPSNGEQGLIYAQTTGSIAFSKSLLNGIKYETGDFVYVDAIKKISNNYDKCFWSATHIDLIGTLPCIKSDVLQNRFNTSESCVTVDVYAIVCRSSHANSSIWLWNDLLGRIFVNNHHYVDHLHAMQVVTVKAQFTAAFEDVPWSAISVRAVHENEDQLREEYGQLMVTDDNWKVLHVCEQTTGGFFGFMEHPLRGAAFMAWTDLNFGEVPPTKNSLCRVTVYNQHRDRRHPWRAILVTQLDPETKKPIHEHPLYPTTGQLHPSIQLQIRQQRAVRQPHPSPVNGNVWTVPSATVMTPKIVAQHQTSSSNTSIDSGRASSGLINDSLGTTPIDHLHGFSSTPLNAPIGAERALSHTNGDSIPRAPSVEPFMINDICDKFTLSTLGSPDNKSYFHPWQSHNPLSYFGSTWQPLNTNTTATPTLERRNTTNGFDSFGFGLSSSPVQSSNSTILDIFKKGEMDVEQYEKFLCEEMLRRPHLLPKLIASNVDAQQLLLSLMKQKQLNSNSTAI